MNLQNLHGSWSQSGTPNANRAINHVGTGLRPVQAERTSAVLYLTGQESEPLQWTTNGAAKGITLPIREDKSEFEALKWSGLRMAGS